MYDIKMDELSNQPQSLSIKQRILGIALFTCYSAILFMVMVLKQVPMIRIGQLMLNFGGTQADRPANFIPFKTILPYFLGDKGLIIAGINLLGNILLLVPLGCLLPYLFPNMTWKQSLIIAFSSGLAIELLQVLLRVGIFDIDDVLLNTLGVMIGYWSSKLLNTWIQAKNYKAIIIAGLLIVGVISVTASAIATDIQRSTKTNADRHPGKEYDTLKNTATEKEIKHDLCGGTGGNGQIISKSDKTFTLKRKDGENILVTLPTHAVINSSSGVIQLSDLSIGERVTLVGGPNPDGTFTADTIFVCSSL